MFTIHLNKLKYFAHHGWHDEESITGAWFEVSVSTSFHEEGSITNLKQTINYVGIAAIIKKNFEQPVALLETLAQQIIAEIKAAEPRIIQINITIEKVNPPIPNFTGTVGVTYSKSF